MGRGVHKPMGCGVEGVQNNPVQHPFPTSVYLSVYESGHESSSKYINPLRTEDEKCKLRPRKLQL